MQKCTYMIWKRNEVHIIWKPLKDYLIVADPFTTSMIYPEYLTIVAIRSSSFYLSRSIVLLILLKFAIVTPQLHFKPSCCYQHIHIQANYNVKTTLWSIWKRNPRKKVNFSRDASRDIASRYVLDLCRYVTSITPSIEIYKAIWNAWFNKLQFQCLR